MNRITLHVGPRNPVWIVPLSLPIALFASASVEWALLFGWFVPAAVVVSHAAGATVERWIPRRLRLPGFMLLAAIIVTLLELLVQRSGARLESLSLLMVRATTVSGVMVWPALVAGPRELWRERMTRAVGVSLGFVVGLTVLALVRRAAGALGIGGGDTVALGFLVLALGRIGLTALRGRRRRRAE